MSDTTSTAALTRLGILQAGRSPEELNDRHTDYNKLFEKLLGESAFEYRHWAVLDNHFPESINDADAWLITGSRHGAYEDHDWIPPLEQLIRDVYAAHAPMVGICFGHQIIAQALGGKVEKFDGGWSAGRVNYQLDSAVFGSPATQQDGQASVTPLLAFHQDQVVVAPPDAKTVGSSDFCKHAALLYDDRMLTIQPHPEFDQAFIEGLIEVRGHILPEDARGKALESLGKPVIREPIADVLRRFLKRQTA